MTVGGSWGRIEGVRGSCGSHREVAEQRDRGTSCAVGRQFVAGYGLTRREAAEWCAVQV